MPKKIGPWCKHYQRNNFKDDHKCDAKIALILEAPGRYEDEDEFGRPVVGPSGFDLSTWWRDCGLRRNDFYIDNTYPFRPPDNHLESISRGERERYIDLALWRLRRQDANVVVVAGNHALRAVLGDPRLAITDWRGSILPWEGKKVIPVIHPAATQRQKVLTKLCVADWRRIAEEAKTKELNLPTRRLVVDPSEEEMGEFGRGLTTYFAGVAPMTASPPRVLSVDVENEIGGSHRLLCVGLSFDPSYAIVVSTMRRDYASDEAFEKAQTWLAWALSREDQAIVGQNFMTDLWKLVMWNPALREPLQANYIWDLIEMAHLDDPNDGGDTKEGSGEAGEEEGTRVGMLDLATLTSLYTREPFYKHLSSHPKQEIRWQYCGLDAAVQREIFDVLWLKLNERRLV